MRHKPIFIGGCERSGTTMLGSYLGKHPALLTTPESQFKEVLMRLIKENGKIDVEPALRIMKKNFRVYSWQIPMEKLTSSLEGHSEVSFQDLMQIMLDLYQEKQQLADTSFWVDHSPNNIRMGVRLSELFPDAKFIHIVRDGRGVAYSYRNVTWGPHETYFSCLDWINKVAYGLALERHLGPDKVLLTRYEDILVNPEKEMGRICDFLGLDYAELASGEERYSVPEFSKRQHALVGKGLKRNNKGRWREGLTQRDIRIFETVAREFLPLMGYDLVNGPDLRPLRHRDKVGIYASELLHKLGKRVLNRMHRRKTGREWRRFRDGGKGA